MKSTASEALISAENTAANPIAPIAGGSSSTRIAGSALLADARVGNRARATMPSSAGTMA